MGKNFTKNFNVLEVLDILMIFITLLFGLVVYSAVQYTLGESKVYQCSMISPDYPLDVKQICRKLKK
jgi:hypothetical protein